MEELLGAHGEELRGRRIALCICGSVAALKSPELARKLIRHGAEVFPVMSDAATKLVRPELVQWATGKPVITNLTGDAEHLKLCGKHKERVDLVIVAPATADTLGKLANGVDDTPVTTVLTTALGSGIPILVAPAMHASLYNNPAVKENIRKLKSFGVEFAEAELAEGKAKMADVERIAALATRILYKKNLAGKKVLVTAGATREYIDDVRFISNPSSGRMGIEIAKEAYLRGADVTLIHGHVDVEIPSYITRIYADSTKEMHDAVMKNLKRADIAVLAAAPSDFAPRRRRGKVRSGRKIMLTLLPTPKLSDRIKKVKKSVKLVLFKAESNVTHEELKKAAMKKMREADADMIVANDVGRRGVGFGSEFNDVLLMKPNGFVRRAKGRKSEIAKLIFDSL